MKRFLSVAAHLFLACTLLHYTWAELLVPFTTHRASHMLRAVRSAHSPRHLHQLLSMQGREQQHTPHMRYPIIFPHFSKSGDLHSLFYARRCEAGVMRQVTLVDQSRANSNCLPPSLQSPSSQSAPSLQTSSPHSSSPSVYSPVLLPSSHFPEPMASTAAASCVTRVISAERATWIPYSSRPSSSFLPFPSFLRKSPILRLDKGGYTRYKVDNQGPTYRGGHWVFTNGVEQVLSLSSPGYLPYELPAADSRATELVAEQPERPQPQMQQQQQAQQKEAEGHEEGREQQGTETREAAKGPGIASRVGAERDKAGGGERLRSGWERSGMEERGRGAVGRMRGGRHRKGRGRLQQRETEARRAEQQRQQQQQEAERRPVPQAARALVSQAAAVETGEAPAVSSSSSSSSSSNHVASRPSWELVSAQPFTEMRELSLGRGPLYLAEADGSCSLDDMSLLQVVRLQRLYRQCCNDRESTRILVKIHQRVALPCATFLFAILGALFAAHLQIRKRQVGFALAVFVIFTYYSLSVTGVLLAQLRVISPMLGGWLPNLAGASVALVLLRMGDVQ
ncbi:hypothetical protein CLOM_g21302 [Closterium sp. NIES-68]|nr:hypothetical protein CLOM_g21302 [Closterium sp. NIES-68]GJP82886.1 hypothetical protein CLOP_g13111 [Closterium sp. NIES-67]